MRKDFYPFRKSITSVRLEKGRAHDRLSVWQRGAKSGDLVVDRGTGEDIFAFFLDTSMGPALTVGVDGDVAVHDVGLAPDTYLGSLDGELLLITKNLLALESTLIG